LLVPDLAYVSMKRLRALSPSDREQPPFAPDIAIEVRSPSFREGFAREKICRYLGTGAILVLDVNPAERVIVAYTRAGETHYAAGTKFQHAAAPWLTFDMDELFADLDVLD